MTDDRDQRGRPGLLLRHMRPAPAGGSAPAGGERRGEPPMPREAVAVGASAKKDDTASKERAASAKAVLETMTKALLIPLPLLLALAAGLMSAKPEIAAGGVTLRVDLAQMLVMIAVAFALMHVARCACTLAAMVARADADPAVAAAITENPAAMNPFASAPALPAGAKIHVLFEGLPRLVSHVLGPISAGLLIGAAAVFITPIGKSPFFDETTFGLLLLGLIALHTIAFAAVTFGIIGALAGLKRWGGLIAFGGSVVLGGWLGWQAAALTEAIRKQAAVVAVPAAPASPSAPRGR
jgi:hypothetical protein